MKTVTNGRDRKCFGSCRNYEPDNIAVFQYYAESRAVNSLVPSRSGFGILEPVLGTQICELSKLHITKSVGKLTQSRWTGKLFSHISEVRRWRLLSGTVIIVVCRLDTIVVVYMNDFLVNKTSVIHFAFGTSIVRFH